MSLIDKLGLDFTLTKNININFAQLGYVHDTNFPSTHPPHRLLILLSGIFNTDLTFSQVLKQSRQPGRRKKSLKELR